MSEYNNNNDLSNSNEYNDYNECGSPNSPPITNPTPQLQLNNNLATQNISNIQNLVVQQQGRLSRILSQQIQILGHQLHLTNPSALWSLASEEETLYLQMEAQMKALFILPQQFLLSSPDIARVRILKSELHKQMKQLELYREELRNLQENTSPSVPLAALVIIRQPFPTVIRKGKQFGEDQLTVQLLTGACNDLSMRGYNDVGLPHITATLLLDNGPAGNISFLEGNTQPIDHTTGVARFPLRFPVGTRKSVVHIKFGMPLSNGPAAPAVESEMSEPLVIITNECQWEGSLGTLIKKDAFGGKLEISWPLFANTLQHYFLVATKQDISNPKRPLSVFDFNYLHQKFFMGRGTVTQGSFDKFWNWFGKIVHVVRYQRHVCSLWQAGVIYGFLDRDSVTNVLVSNKQPVGTFIIRFSERHAGQFDIVWVGSTQINHYLVKADDINGPKKTLPDFISLIPQFVYLLQLTVGEDGNPLFLHVPKDAAIQQYVIPRTGNSHNDGYSDITNN